eukprot:COSAG02_NODE_12581_length_1522_cov_72.104257_1_plen_57_part_10
MKHTALQQVAAHQKLLAMAYDRLSHTFVKRHDPFVPDSLAQAVRSTRVQQTFPCHDI